MRANKKIIFYYSLFSVICSLIFAACDNPLIDDVFNPIIVTFETNGGSKIKNQSVFKGDKVVKPGNPTKPGNDFIAWYGDIYLISEWNFKTIPVGDITLYAKWDDSGIELSPSELNIVKIGGYAPINENEFVVTVINSSIAAQTGELIIELSGENEDLFSLTRNIIDDIPARGSDDFSVIPNHGLPIGSYSAVITVKGNLEGVNDKISKSIDVNFRVVKDITNLVILSQPKLVYTYGEPLDLSELAVNVSYSDGSSDSNLPFSGFASTDRFFTTNPAHGDIISVLENNEHPVKIFWADREITETDNLTVYPAPISSASISVTPPYSGNAPDTAAKIAPESNFTVSPVTWSPNHSKFAYGTSYTAAVTLTVVNGNYTFTGGLTNARINGEIAAVSANNGTTATLSRELETARAFINNITIITPPTTVYTHGSELDLTGLKVNLHYSDGTGEDVTYNAVSNIFPGNREPSESITANPANRTRLLYETHDGNPLTITYENTSTGVKVSTSINLTVNRKPLTITGVTAQTRVYNGTTTVTLSGGTLQGIVQGESVGFTLGNGSMADANAGTKTVTTNIVLTGTHAGNYTLTQPTVTVTINRVTLTITKVEHTKVYDNSATASNPKITLSVIPDDDVSAGNVTANYTSVNAGTKTINVSVTSLTGNDSGNYNLPPPLNNYTITDGGITKAPGTDVTTPEFDSIGKNDNGETTIVIKAVTPGIGQGVQYAINTSISAPSSGWTTSTTFSRCNGKLITNQTYYVFARSAGDNNYEAGTPSPASSPITLHRVNFNYNIWELPLSYVLVLDGNKIPEINIPKPSDQTFLGWYSDSSCQIPVGEDYLVTDDITIYGKWNPK